jgi:hypothetical protein
MMVVMIRDFTGSFTCNNLFKDSLDHYVSFKYLGSLVTDLNEMEIKIKSRLAVGNKSYHALGPILKKGLCLSQLKFVYKTVIRPIVIYGAEAWTFT